MWLKNEVVKHPKTLKYQRFRVLKFLLKIFDKKFYLCYNSF